MCVEFRAWGLQDVVTDYFLLMDESFKCEYAFEPKFCKPYLSIKRHIVWCRKEHVYLLTKRFYPHQLQRKGKYSNLYHSESQRT